MTGGEVVTRSGKRYRLGERLGEGAQGVVHRLDRPGLVVKLYTRLPPDRLQLQLRRLDRIQRLGSPSPCFVWPEDLVESPRPGLVMAEVEPSFVPLWKLCSSPLVQEVGLRVRLRVAYRLAEALRRLHMLQGSAFCDLSDGNVWAHPGTGQVRIIDCDNLAVRGVLDPVVSGTPRWMAPEVQDGRSAPDILSDCHSLAVLLYQLLLFHHPLLGDQALDDFEAETLALGGRAVYVNHPRNGGNRLTRFDDFGGLPASTLPRGLQEVFHTAFVPGLHRPVLRVTELRWQRVLLGYLDRMVRCPGPSCPAGHIAVDHPARSLACPRCGAVARDPAFLEFLDPHLGTVVGYRWIEEGTTLAPHHRSRRDAFDLGTPVAAVSGVAGVGFALRNESGQEWTYRRPGARAAEPFPSGMRMRLQPGYEATMGRDGHVVRLWAG